MDIGWSHYVFVFVGHEKGGYEAYFIAAVCSFRLILQRNWQSIFVCAWIVTILLFMFGFSFSSKRPYYGLPVVEARTPHERWVHVEHWRPIRQHQIGLATAREAKYADMTASGGIGQWPFLPYISCGRQIELSKLQHLDSFLSSL